MLFSNHYYHCYYYLNAKHAAKQLLFFSSLKNDFQTTQHFRVYLVLVSFNQ